jgi:hypothetical protein
VRSGIETISHIRENGRITVMFSAFEGPPRILRLFGVGKFLYCPSCDSDHAEQLNGGTVHEYGTPEYNALIPAETRKPGSRAAIVVDVYQVGTVRIRPSRIISYKGLLTVTFYALHPQ